MTCSEFRALLDREGAAAERLGADHLRGCAACRQELARVREAEAQLSAMGEEAVPEFLHERIMAHLRAEGGRVPVPLPWWRPVWAGPLLAIGLLVALAGAGLWHLAQRGGSQPPAGVVAEAGREAKAPPVLVGGGQPVPDLVPAPVATRYAPVPPAAAKPKEGAVHADATPVAVAQPMGVVEVERGEAVLYDERLAAAAPAVPLTADQAPAAHVAEPLADGTSRPEPALAARALPERGKAPMARGAVPPRLVRCQLLDEAHVPAATFSLPAGALPQEGFTWAVTVGESGDVSVVDEQGNERPAVAEAIRHTGSLPPPGRYRLTQAPVPEY